MAKISKKTMENLEDILNRGCDYAATQEKTNNIRVRQLHQINASSRAIGWAKQKMREGKNNDCISD